MANKNIAPYIKFENELKEGVPIATIMVVL